MIGRNRTNRKISEKKKPIVPINIDRSITVGEYIAHDDGRKSRFKLVTMITKRSSHIPRLTTSEIMNSQNGLSRNRLNHRSWIDIPLHRISSQYDHQYGPSHIRFLTMKTSYWLALYQPKNASIAYP